MLLTLSESIIEGGLKTTIESTLGHELQHAYDYDQGNMKRIVDQKSYLHIKDHLKYERFILKML